MRALRTAQKRWLAFCRAIGAGEQARATFAQLDLLYGEPGRFYHGWGHILACLGELRRDRKSCADPAVVEMALWFHDAVYDTRAGDNEERSARLAVLWAERLGLPAGFSRAVERLVLATKVTAGRAPDSRPQFSASEPAADADPDAAMIADIDLAILGRSRCAFDFYEHRIRREYAWLPEEAFRRRRAELLRSLLVRPSMYRTERFRKRYEARARRNLRRSVQRLEPVLPQSSTAGSFRDDSFSR